MRLDTCIITSAANLVLEAAVNSCSCSAMSVESTLFRSFWYLDAYRWAPCKSRVLLPWGLLSGRDLEVQKTSAAGQKLVYSLLWFNASLYLEICCQTLKQNYLGVLWKPEKQSLTTFEVDAVLLFLKPDGVFKVTSKARVICRSVALQLTV